MNEVIYFINYTLNNMTIPFLHKATKDKATTGEKAHDHSDKAPKSEEHDHHTKDSHDKHTSLDVAETEASLGQYNILSGLPAVK